MNVVTFKALVIKAGLCANALASWFWGPATARGRLDAANVLDTFITKGLMPVIIFNLLKGSAIAQSALNSMMGDTVVGAIVANPVEFKFILALWVVTMVVSFILKINVPRDTN